MPKMPKLNKDKIIAADNPKLKEVEVPEWGGSVNIRVMTVGERDNYENDWIVNKSRGVENFRTKFLAMCLCDDDGNRLFSDAEVPMLSKKSAKVMSRLWQIAMDYNALTEADVEELAKNSPSVQV